MASPPAYPGKPEDVATPKSQEIGDLLAQLLDAKLDAKGAEAYLRTQSWPPGLIQTLLQECAQIPYRFMIVDDSGSMSAADGSRLAGQRFVRCTRWSELGTAMRFHADLAEAANAPTEFRVLNGQTYIVGSQFFRGRDQAFKERLSASPSGRTPLCRHINEVEAKVRLMAPILRNRHQKAAVVIATDGQASDGAVHTAINKLHDLPVMVVVRLCTDEEPVTRYWDEVDAKVELNIDVIDDLAGEAEEVFKANPWLSYGLPLQQCREFGVRRKELDLLDESVLSLDQARRVTHMILGGSLDEYPDPCVDFKAFAEFVQSKLQSCAGTFSPHQKGNRPWIRLNKMRRTYANAGGCNVM